MSLYKTVNEYSVNINPSSVERVVFKETLLVIADGIKLIEECDNGEIGSLQCDKELSKIILNLQSGHTMERAVEKRLYEIEKELKYIKSLVNKKVKQHGKG